jgi:hypothetical protein
VDWLSSPRLVPQEYPIESRHGTIALGPEYIAPFRQAFRRSFDGHGVYRPDERSWIVVRKTFPIGFFKEIESLPMYASPDDAARGQLRGVVETSNRAWWLDGIVGKSQGDERELKFHIWEAGPNWLARLAPEMETQIQDLPVGNILICLDLSKGLLGRSQETLVSVSAEGSVSVSVDLTMPTITVAIDNPFLGLLQRPANDGEK